MKKILAILLAGMMTATALVGCGGGDSSSKTDNGSKADNGSSDGAAKIEGSIVDDSYFGDEGTDSKPVTLKVWAPDAAVSLVKEQVEAFKKAYPNRKFKEISVVAQGEKDAATNMLNDATTAADVFSFPSDQLNKLVDAGVISQVAFKDAVTEANDEGTVKAGTLNGTLYAYPETNDNGYYLVYDKSVVSDEQAQTLEGILDACKKAGKKFIMNAGDGYYACTFAFTAGVKIDGLEKTVLHRSLLNMTKMKLLKHFRLLQSSSRITEVHSNRLTLLTSLQVLQAVSVAQVSTVHGIQLLTRRLSVTTSVLQSFLQSMSTAQTSSLSQFSVISTSV